MRGYQVLAAGNPLGRGRGSQTREFSKSLLDCIIDELFTNPKLVADTFRDLMYASGEPMATSMMLGSMLLLENYLQRYTLALEYAQLLSRKEPGSVMALQFRLYLSTQLQLPDAKAEAINELELLRESGLLNREETDNLELFINE